MRVSSVRQTLSFACSLLIVFQTLAVTGSSCGCACGTAKDAGHSQCCATAPTCQTCGCTPVARDPAGASPQCGLCEDCDDSHCNCEYRPQDPFVYSPPSVSERGDRDVSPCSSSYRVFAPLVWAEPSVNRTEEVCVRGAPRLRLQSLLCVWII